MFRVLFAPILRSTTAAYNHTLTSTSAIYPLERDPVPIAKAAGWASGPVWTGGENLVHPSGIQSLNRPARSQSLYGPRYPDPRWN
jgi:hypothetical protein